MCEGAVGQGIWDSEDWCPVWLSALKLMEELVLLGLEQKTVAHRLDLQPADLQVSC
jgi:hypothetical protein